MRSVGSHRAIVFTRLLVVLVTGTLWACGGRKTAESETQMAESETQTIDQNEAPSAREYCVSGGAGPIRISEDSIGPLNLSATVKGLRAVCPAALDTVWYGENDVYPAVAFLFDGLTAVAVQYQDSLLPNQPAERWFVRGANGLILGQVALSASWVDVERSFGAGIGEAPDGVTVMFCAHRRILFELDASPHSVTPGRPAELSR